jgi:hypothetical protein
MEVSQHIGDRGRGAAVRQATRYLDTAGVRPAREWHGVYAAKVVNIQDPLQQKRVKVRIPQVLGTAISNWAPPVFNPNLPVPAVGTLVNAVFLGGDINWPLYYPPFKVPQASDWQLITPTGGWSAVSGLIKPQVRTTAAGSAEIIGNLQGGTTTDSTVIGTLPAGTFSTTNAHYAPLEAITGAAAVNSTVTSATVPGQTAQLVSLAGSVNNSNVDLPTTLIPTANHTQTIPSGGGTVTLGPSGIQFDNIPTGGGSNVGTLHNAAITLNDGDVTVSPSTISGQTTPVNYNTPCVKIDTSGNIRIFNVNSHVGQISFNIPSLPLNTL